MALIGKGSKLYSIFLLKCPKCHEHPLFDKGNWFSINKLYNMPKACPNCQQDFEIEVGFYWGAMYVGYGVCIGVMFLIMGLSLLLTGNIPRSVLYASVAVVLLGFAYWGRLSRAIWINLFVHYEKRD